MKEEDIDKKLDDILSAKEGNETEDVSVEETEVASEKTEADKLAELEEKCNELNDSYLRLNAEFDNYRKRTMKEKAELLKLGSEKVLLDIISVVDDFERALEHTSKTDDVVALREGIDLIHNKFIKFLSKHNVKEIEAIDKPFDTDRHEALTTIPADSEEKKDVVVDCVQKGYTLDDKVIRYSKVIVAK